MNSSPQITIVVPRRQPARTRLHWMYFSQGGEAASRYRITFDRVMLHLWRARRVNRRLRLSGVMCLDDIIHAIACIDDNDLAWADLAERHEPALARRSRGEMNEVTAILAVRRMFADLRRQSCDDGPITALNLRGFWGHRPLRTWLSDRLSAILARDAIAHRRASRLLPTAPPRLAARA